MTDHLLPLVVDLDGTLITTDVTFKSLKSYVQGKPWRYSQIVWWFLWGRAFVKQQLAKRVVLDFSSLPYRKQLLQYLQQEHKKGRLLVLATAADQIYALGVAHYLRLFAEVYASDGRTNLRAKAKARVLVKRFGEKKFAYAGDSRHDLPVWSVSAEAIVVGDSSYVKNRVGKMFVVVREF